MTVYGNSRLIELQGNSSKSIKFQPGITETSVIILSYAIKGLQSTSEGWLYQL